MEPSLESILTKIGEDYSDIIEKASRHYLEVSLSRTARELGLTVAQEKYRHAYAIVPLKRPLSGMKVRIDGRTFVNYAQLRSGIAVPPYIARQAGLPYRPYAVRDSMICNYA